MSKQTKLCAIYSLFCSTSLSVLIAIFNLKSESEQACASFLRKISNSNFARNLSLVMLNVRFRFSRHFQTESKIKTNLCDSEIGIFNFKSKTLKMSDTYDEYLSLYPPKSDESEVKKEPNLTKEKSRNELENQEHVVPDLTVELENQESFGENRINPGTNDKVSGNPIPNEEIETIERFESVGGIETIERFESDEEIETIERFESELGNTITNQDPFLFLPNEDIEFEEEYDEDLQFTVINF